MVVKTGRSVASIVLVGALLAIGGPAVAASSHAGGAPVGSSGAGGISITVPVAPAAPVAPGEAADPADPATGSVLGGGALAVTGGDVTLLAVLAVAAIGSGAVLVHRRRSGLG